MIILNAMFSKVNGGLEQVFLNYTPTLGLQGNRVIPIVHPQAQVLAQCPPGDVVTVHNFNQHDPVAIFKLRRLVNKHKPDCIITHSYRAAYLFKKTRTRVPKVAVCHVKGHYEFGTDAIIAITETMRQEIIASGVAENRVFTVPNMVFLPQDFCYKKPRQRTVPIIGVCARFARIKGVDIFLEALLELKKRNVSFLAHIAGDGPEKEAYRHFILKHGLNEQVQFLGWVDDKQSFYEDLDIFCLPSREEAFGLVILESMMHSLPMVLADLSGPREIIAQSNSALFVPPENPIAMADALERIIQEQALAEQMSMHSFERVQYYSAPNVAPILQHALRQICENYHK